MSKNGLADRLNQFLKLGDQYFVWFSLERQHLAIAAAEREQWVENPAVAPAAGVTQTGIKDAADAQQRRNESREELMKIGPLLAQELEQAGQDSSELLTFLHQIDGGGGPEAAIEGWLALKMLLQRVLL